MSVGIVDKQTGDRIPTAGMPAIDNALDLTSVNPVQNAVITAALDNKQDKTDNSLQTTDKTIVGAINEHEGDISSLKSGFTDLDNEVNGDATVYPYADVITIPDAVPANLADCSVKIEPVQDLHGYDKPWVGGASKNKLITFLSRIKSVNSTGVWSGNTYTLNDITFEVLVDDADNVLGIKINGTASANTVFIITRSPQDDMFLAQNNYVLSGCPSGGSNNTYYIGVNHNTVAYGYDTGNGLSFAVEEGHESDVIGCWISIASGVSITNEVFYPMIRLSTETDATFAPYTNVCPISGHTEVDVQRDGVNLLNPTKFARKNPDSGEASNNWAIWEDYIRCNYNDSFTLNCGIGHVQIYRIIVSCFDKYMNHLGNISETYIYGDGYTFTINIAGTKYCRVQLYNANSMAGYDFSTAQLELGSSATDYEPYQGKTYTIALGDTIYGGTVDFDSGVMTAKYVSKTFDENVVLTVGTSQSSGLRYADIVYSQNDMGAKRVSDNYMICSSYAKIDSSDTPTYGKFRVYSDSVAFLDEDFVDVASAKAKLNGVQLVYELATPTTIQLTPQQIQLLKGTNTLTASTGQISVTANGVSGSIGSVQEQVNELAEDVAEIKPLNYSTTEQETGRKWLNDPTYIVVIDMGEEKTVTSNTWYTVGNHLGTDTIINGMGITGSGGTVPIQIVEDTNDGIKILQTRNAQVGVRYVWLEYIKTT